MKASYALRREGTADEVADLVCFLACSESSYRQVRTLTLTVAVSSLKEES